MHDRTSTMVDTTEALPMPTSESFLLTGEEWPMPVYETADEFVAQLARRELPPDLLVEDLRAFFGSYR
jgi:hypothetical protein